MHSRAERSSIRGDAGPADQSRQCVLARSGRLRRASTTDLFGAERIPAPNFGFRVDWYRFGDTQLHIFPEDDKAPKRHHLGISVDDILPVYRRAQELGVIDPVFTDHVRVLDDGNVQFYLRDPGGNLIEINGPVGDYTTDDIPELKPLDGALPPGARERRRPALPVNSLLEARCPHHRNC